MGKTCHNCHAHSIIYWVGIRSNGRFMLSFVFINCIIKYCCLFCWRPAVMASALQVAFRTLFTCLFIFLFGFCAKNKFFFWTTSERSCLSLSLKTTLPPPLTKRYGWDTRTIMATLRRTRDILSEDQGWQFLLVSQSKGRKVP